MTLITNTAISKPAIACTGDARFVVVWEVANGADLMARFINADGEVVGPEFRVNTSLGGATRPVATQTGDFGNPGFAVAWNDENSHRVLMQVFRGDGSKVGGEIVVNSVAARVEDTPMVAKLSNQIVVAWTSAGAGGDGLRASFFKPDGTKLGEVRVDAGNAVNMGPIAGAALENDTFAVAWHGGSNVASARPHLRILKSDRTTIGLGEDAQHGPG